MKKYQLYILSVLAGLLLAFAWFPHGWIPLLFVAFVPLLWIEHLVYQNPERFKSRIVFFTSFLSFFIWNLLTTWWLKNASVGGAVMAIGLNSIFMSLVFLFFHKIKKRIGEKWGYLIFISIWITFEFLYHGDQLTWPWLTLGNAFADSVSLIQWYEYTGIFGGSLWVLIINYCFFNILTEGITKGKGIVLALMLLLPIGVSFLLTPILTLNKVAPNQHQIVIVQPNIDPYNEKFSGSYEQQLQKMLELASQKTDSTTEYIVLPETALIEDIWEDELQQASSVLAIQEFVKRYPKVKMIIGASTAKAYKPGEPLSPTARKFYNADAYYDAYNTAFQFDNSGHIQQYHKSKLVPGVEQMPLQFIFKYLDKLALEMGGTSGSLGTQVERSVFYSKDETKTIAPVICYESVYGEYVTEYVRKGATLITIITNDGWWGNTPGHIQHLKLGRLRAIENRRWIARSANTGISCFIDPYGKISQATDYWVPAVISGAVEYKNQLTFYTRFGDYIGRMAMFISFLLIIYSWLIRFRIIKKS
ncbi:MAG: apolipoprotein N-acyltransferase [Bacteroidetes bacterium]|nr:apolipoprotein N-acyltransferase [Bacteroidota bacterium]